jgi:hypothetical protein
MRRSYRQRVEIRCACDRCRCSEEAALAEQASERQTTHAHSAPLQKVAAGEEMIS